MRPIFNRSGHVCAWLRDDSVFCHNGAAIAFLHQTDVISYRGNYLGSFSRGYFRDRRGAPVAWMEHATGGPVLLIPAPLPDPPVPDIIPERPSLPVSPVRSVDSLLWSRLTWDNFLDT
ncbi:4-fold beta flower protein [Streptomyces sp. SBT349]|uniref:4-fold beta flower protein n=1 Tax=Streptomyces sp. SBT349 TaxID=1580539 RepID=UPI003B640A20